ncbi:MAG: sulfurtransferase TusA family protein [Shimia sp.]|jgi:tRNA 2-thiouridine synthesizing protein A|uniref:sulfurtransferase TusA family protein n=1 Tax=Shimia sp. TaxID=1954381 RepID=UPI0040591210
MDLEIDALGLLCPLPVLRLRKRMMPLASGAQVRLIADDPAAVIDVPHFCNENNHLLVDMTDTQGTMTFVIQKA